MKIGQYEFKNARWGNAEKTCILLDTQEHGEVFLAIDKDAAMWSDVVALPGVREYISRVQEPEPDERNLAAELDDLKAKLIAAGIML